MTDYDHLAGRLRDGGTTSTPSSARWRALEIETPSWGYGDSGTRFATFPQPGRPRDVFERLDDAAEVHRLTGTAPRRRAALPVGRRRRPRRAARARRRRAACASAPSTRTCSRTPTTSSARSPTPTRRCARKAVDHLLECLRDRRRARLDRAVAVVRRRHQLPRPGRPARAPPAAARRRSARSTPRSRTSRSCCVEYKLFEPAFYATDLADWGSALLVCQKLGERAPRAGRPRPPRAGHQRRADRRAAGRRGPPRRLPLQQPQVRRRRPDRRLGQPVRAVPDLLRAGRPGAAAAADDRPGAQRRGQGRGDGAQRRQPPGGLRQGAARRPRRAAPPRRRPATCSAATRCCSTPTAPTCGPLCAKVRAGARRGRGSGRRAARVRLRGADRRRERGATAAVAGGWGR